MTGADLAILERLLANETDMAYRRRARIPLDRLDLRDGSVRDGVLEREENTERRHHRRWEH